MGIYIYALYFSFCVVIIIVYSHRVEYLYSYLLFSGKEE